MAIVEIDRHSGFCFGVVNAIRKAEEQLEVHRQLYCLGDIVHNSTEVERLRRRGLQTVTHSQLGGLHDTRLLFRAHGEPPGTYKAAKDNHIEVVDATCPVVLHLQKRIKQIYESRRGSRTQLLIFGKSGHAEVNGLVGQTNDTAIVIEKPEDLSRVDFSRPVVLFSQTTKSEQDYHQLVNMIRSRMQTGVPFESHDTICRQFANRMPQVQAFAADHDCLVFVSDGKSSNGMALFNACLTTNPHSYFVSGPLDLQKEWFRDKEKIGISGATSTPTWLMEQVRSRIVSLLDD
ncbi:MAG: 4-hydroxy-3-methylbut-2-enyl diphosphate reductase [Bacteroidales bacterium]|nr:4-hydroxy-3-methylbut-2-enyl diphosphate reductase [Bacteroidales bacterium]